MLTNAPVMPSLPATDIARAKTFYTDVLGLHIMEEHADRVTFWAGEGTYLMLYRRSRTKADHTAASFEVRHIEDVMADLREKGVQFISYDVPGLKTVNGVAEHEGIKAAWFNDTEGNILGISERVQ